MMHYAIIKNIQLNLEQSTHEYVLCDDLQKWWKKGEYSWIYPYNYRVKAAVTMDF